MAKYVKILLLLSLVISTTIDFGVLDTDELQHNVLEENHQELALNLDHVSYFELHCAGHCLHHFVASKPVFINHMKSTIHSLVPFVNLTVEFQASKPATPPPLFYLS